MQKHNLSTLLDIVNRTPTPTPWAEGEKIPWNEPGFSKRMLHEHLSQEHDAASRRTATIEQHVSWIHQYVLGGKPSRILDLGCGPGLYASRLSRLGHTCTGIDFSPASIEYAQEQARQAGLSCTYRQEDIRQADFGSGHNRVGYNLVMLIYGELNVFRPQEARNILSKARAALAKGGRLLLEPHTLEAVQQIGEEPRDWYSSPSGLFSERPHLYLTENCWDAGQQAAILRYFIVDAESGQVTRHASSMQGYSQEEYRKLLEECGFEDVQFYAGMGEGWRQKELEVIVAKIGHES